MTRNERRKAAKVRLAAKQERFLGRVEAQRLETVRAAVRHNMKAPAGCVFRYVADGKEIVSSTIWYQPIRRIAVPLGNGLHSCLAGMSGQSHRGYICRAGGQMNRGRAMALAVKPANKRSDRYAKPVTGDRSQRPITE